MIDFIGDIHGYADKLEALLFKLGYKKSKGVFSHPERKVLFIGDYIDRGPQIRETLEIVKTMADSGNAIALMGNHEFNAICFHFQSPDGGYLRKHSIKNIMQHFETLKQFQNKQKEYDDYIDWFKTLPLFYETKTFRAVHACWDKNNISFLNNILDNGKLNDDFIRNSVKSETILNDAIEQTLKGKEIQLPKGFSFHDKDGAIRKEIRTKWWENPLQSTYKSISVEPIDNLPDQQISATDLTSVTDYPEQEKPVFFGHYWLKGLPFLYKKNVCCLDYSVAKEGNLVAYRFDNENILDKSKFIWV